ncbi:ATP-binding cassette domain-containing protein [Pullulanibacillus sp. KACC 23026]|uniref:ATP-binding cassette domain-containing protein n=1 Tax=Pullulanibacillus sp. KACC 23026 TaxID=3028315 RepID=UPI0023AF7664|nr:ATP-binding cassette domain-containing protein [Pullulanibacillus sp. KACC 23026]WEG14754.1 ATP-binding cassette domain-containing protein [Pullulanibacillus sp. KACC 23026]
MSEKKTPFLSVQSIKKSYGAVQALGGVSFDVYPGEVVALVGDNGAGKSTTIKMIAGVAQPDEGQILIEGKPVALNGPAISEKYGIQTVYQDLALCDNLDIVSNLYLGRELRKTRIPGVLSTLDKIQMETKAGPVLKDLKINLPPLNSLVASLSGGQRQVVAVARAVLWGSKLVMLDEPTAALGVAQQRTVLDLIKNLRDKGVGVIVISHNMADVFEVADRIVVLRLGKTVANFITKESTREEVIAAITGASEGGQS